MPIYRNSNIPHKIMVINSSFLERCQIRHVSLHSNKICLQATPFRNIKFATTCTTHYYIKLYLFPCLHYTPGPCKDTYKFVDP